jgi:hypothetical protein
MKALMLMLPALLVMGWTGAIGQQKVPDRSYSRVSLTIIYLDDPNPDPNFNAGIGQTVRNFFEQSKLIGPKYNDHTISTRSARVDVDNFTAENRTMIGNPKETGQILDFVNKSDISRQVVSKWFDRQPDGTFKMDLIGQRGLYNASDNDYITAAASQRQFATLKDQGEKLLKVSYLLFVNISDVKYTEVKSLNSGSWSGLARGYLYKLNWNDSVSANFYQNLWIAEGDAEAVKSAKKKAFDSTVFPIVHVKNLDVSASKSNSPVNGVKPSDTEVITGIINSMYESLIVEIDTKVSDFQVRQGLISSKPIGATIGSKEGLYVDQRFFVFENVQNWNKQVVQRRRAVIRAKTVVNNEKVTEGKSNPSIFYQVGGGKIDHFGMYMVQKNDKGIAFTITSMKGNMGGLNGTLEYNLSRSFSKTMKLKTIPTGVNFFIDLAVNNGNYSDVEIPGYFSSRNDDFSFFRVSGGFSKDYYFLKNFHISPRIGYGIENTSLYDKGESGTYPDGLSAMGDHILIGGSGGLNLLHNFQLIGGCNIYIPVGDLWMTAGSEKSVPLTMSWSKVFYGRQGLSIFGGVRILL